VQPPTELHLRIQSQRIPTALIGLAVDQQVGEATLVEPQWRGPFGSSR
jgi:hypothetical protein